MPPTIKKIENDHSLEDSTTRTFKKVNDNLNKIKRLLNTNMSYITKISRKASIEDSFLENPFKKSFQEHQKLLLLLSKIEIPDNN